MSKKSVTELSDRTTQSPVDMENRHIKYKYGELGRKILLLLVAGTAITAVVAVPNMGKILFPGLRRLSEKLNSDGHVVRKSLRGLKKKKLISLRRDRGGFRFVLTSVGKKYIAQGEIDAITICPMEKWDKKWRVVVFDIPETKKETRRDFRGTLCRLGFFQLQKSCFVHPFECKNEIDFIISHYRISPYVHYLLSDFESDAELRDYFEV